jgi:hypothetical protein
VNRQRTYDLVRDHLLNQGGRSFGLDENYHIDACLYRDPRGRRCAIGALIPDELITPYINGNSVHQLPTAVLEYLGVESEQDRYFLGSLQQIHDLYYPNYWSAKLYDFAIDNGLRP